MQQQQHKEPECKFISGVELHLMYPVISELIGFTDEHLSSYRSDIIDLIQLWGSQGYVEVFEEDELHQYGRAKDTASVQGSVPWYYGMYHARIISNSTDPLIVLVFEDRSDDGETLPVASIRFLATHDDLFGVKGGKVKSSKEQMNSLRKQIDGYIQMGNRYNEEQKKLKQG